MDFFDVIVSSQWNCSNCYHLGKRTISIQFSDQVFPDVSDSSGLEITPISLPVQQL